MPSLHRQQAERPGSEPRHAPPAKDERSTTPPRPSFSPVTPTISHPGLVSDDRPADLSPAWIDEPEPLPVSLEDNPDAIALRAAISILQLQRQRSLRDIKALDKMKAAALQRPEMFVEKLKAGKLAKPDPLSIIDMDDSDGDTAEDTTRSSEEVGDAVAARISHFGTFPNAQNVVRSPPINWHKYHVVGESLDKLHEQQQKRPGSGGSAEQHSRLQPEHAIAAPYRPFADKLEPSPATPIQRGGTT